MDIRPDFLQAALNIAAEIIEVRRKVHQYPELGFEENETAGLIAGKLQTIGLDVVQGVGKTGVVGLLRGGFPGPTLAVRADMDALPIMENTGLSYASVRPGLMHACGHDAHIAVVLGAAMILNRFRPLLRGNLKFIFQPCEETPPGGALEMIAMGVLGDPKVDGILGLHVNPLLPAGTIGIKHGTVMAAADMFKIIIRGKGGHGAAPHQAADAIVAAAAVIQALQTLVSRRVDPVQPAVITVGTIAGGNKSNIIADRVEMKGTVRTLCPELRVRLPALMEEIIKSSAQAYNTEADLAYEFGYPPLENSPGMVELVREAASLVVGPGRVIEVQHSSMGGEDFAYFLRHSPGAYFYLGVGKDNAPNYPWHHPQFDISETALTDGAATLAAASFNFLNPCGGLIG
ncbi:MAG: amidohydrolase [Syntrophomonadaceae bacterium]|nr:amidohydrolase [Syntrophomonadaceae bacterium]